ncbi:MAG TPA: hypothetical protein PKD10_16070, partial [Paracoccaceae bacterium]|nr:hypothetical protein [Paracoccaceae bacterium]
MSLGPMGSGAPPPQPGGDPSGPLDPAAAITIEALATWIGVVLATGPDGCARTACGLVSRLTAAGAATARIEGTNTIALHMRGVTGRGPTPRAALHDWCGLAM